MKLLAGGASLLFLLIFCACNAIEHQCDDSCDTEIDNKRYELNDLNLNIDKAKAKARRINHYIKKRLEELKKLYGEPEDESEKQPGLDKENDRNAKSKIPSDPEGLVKVTEKIEEGTGSDLGKDEDLDDSEYDKCDSEGEKDC